MDNMTCWRWRATSVEARAPSGAGTVTHDQAAARTATNRSAEQVDEFGFGEPHAPTSACFQGAARGPHAIWAIPKKFCPSASAVSWRLSCFAGLCAAPHAFLGGPHAIFGWFKGRTEAARPFWTLSKKFGWSASFDQLEGLFGV